MAVACFAFLALGAGAGASQYTGWGPDEVVAGPSASYFSFNQYLEDSNGDGWAFYVAPAGGESAFARHRSPDGSWDAAVLLETVDTGDVGCLVVVAASNGDMLAAMTLDPGAGHMVYSNRYTAGSGWGGAGAISTSTNGSVSGCPSAYIDGDGGAVVVWRQSDSGILSAWGNEWRAGSGWQGATLLEADESGSVSTVRVRGDAWGNSTVVWTQQMASFRGAYARPHSGSNGWGTTTLLQSSTTQNASLALVSVAPVGVTMAVWQQTGLDPLQSRMYTASGGWSSVALVATGGRDPALGGVSADETGNFTILWTYDPSGPLQAWANHWSPSMGWSAPHRLDTSGDVEPVYLQSAADDGGNVVFVWSQNEGPYSSIWSARLDATGGWSPAARLDPASSSQNGEPTIGGNGQGDFCVVWHRHDGAVSTAQSAWYMVGRGWQPTQPVHADTTFQVVGYSTAVIFSAQGLARAIYVVSDGGEYAFGFSPGETPRFDPPLLQVTAPVEGLRTGIPVVHVEGATEPGMAVTVDGGSVGVDALGRFSTELSLGPGDHTVLVNSRHASGLNSTVAVRVTIVDLLPLLEGQLGDVQAQLNATLAELGRAVAAAEAAQGNANASAAQVGALRAQLNATAQVVWDTQADLGNMSARMAAGEAITQAALDELNDTSASLASARAEILILHSSLDSMALQMDAAQSDLDGANAKLDAQAQELAAARLDVQGLAGTLTLLIVLTLVSAALGAMGMLVGMRASRRPPKEP